VTDGATMRSGDAIVVGTGMGGDILGRALAERGPSALLLETDRTGWRAGETYLDASVEDPVGRLLRGAWSKAIDVKQEGTQKSFFAALGCRVGGSSVFHEATLERPEPRDFGGHACSTTRMGAFPTGSVVDAHCRAHGIGDLWAADAGIFPTSLGTNPSLTIAANALRMAEIIAAEPAR
jgi:choline dehydrogenase-like flavoprotein